MTQPGDLCPYCQKQISDKEIAKHLGSKGGGFRENVDYSKISQMRTDKKGWPKGKPRKPKLTPTRPRR